MYALFCRKPPYWCGWWRKFGFMEWAEREIHEANCKGKRN